MNLISKEIWEIPLKWQYSKCHFDSRADGGGDEVWVVIGGEPYFVWFVAKGSVQVMCPNWVV